MDLSRQRRGEFMIVRSAGADWVQSDGGPLILLERHLLPEWMGILPSRDGRRSANAVATATTPSRTDYDRACKINDYVGVVPVGAAHGLVLNDVPLLTTWRKSTEGGGMIVRWDFAD